MPKQPPPTVDAILARAARLRAVGASLLRDADALNPAAGPAPPSTPPSTSTTDPVSRLRPPPQLLKAQTTRLGLLLLNPPLAPVALDAILADLEQRALPGAFAAAADAFAHRPVLGACFCAAVLAALRDMLGCVAPVAEAVTHALAPRPSSAGDVPLDVGRAWAACDALVALADGGVAAAAAARLRSVTDLVRDAREEFEGWRADLDYEAEAGGEEDGGSSTSGGDHDDSKSADERERTLEELAGNWTLDSDNRLPAYRTDLVDMCDRFLRQSDLARKAVLAVSKNRVKNFAFPPLPFKDAPSEALAKREAGRFDRYVELAESMQNDCDEFACAMYDLNGDDAKLRLEDLTKNAVDIVDLARLTGDQKEDELTGRLRNWKTQLCTASEE
jgi:hypothetical protein